MMKNNKEIYTAIFIFLSLANCTGQKLNKVLIAPIVDSGIYYTRDSIVYYQEGTPELMSGTYDIYELVNAIPYDSLAPTDIERAPIYAASQFHSKGKFVRGRKEGVWIYRNDTTIIRRDYYKAGKLISREICPCRR